MTSDTRLRRGILVLGALGVVFGDIGTSPLYALRECFAGTHAIPVSSANVLGVLSLIVWSLVITVSIKYVLFVMRSDNAGEAAVWRSSRSSAARPDPRRTARSSASACSGRRFSTATA